jgi:O-antigen/teichoic acid export membrane protein
VTLYRSTWAISDSVAAAVVEPPAEPAAAPAERGRGLRGALAWAYVLNTGGYAVTALLTFVLAAILDPRAFGVLAIGTVFITLGQSLLHHGPTMAVIQQDDITEEHFNAAFWSTLAGAAVFSGLLALTAPLWAALNRLPDLTLVTIALAPVLIINALTVIPDAYFRRRMQMRGIALRVVSSNLAGGVVGVGCALAGFGVWSLILQQLAAAVVYNIILWSVTPWRPRLRGIRQPFRDIRRTSVQTILGAFGNFAATRSDVLLMGAFFGPVVVGLYRFAARFADMAVDLTGRGLRDVSLPHLARHGRDPDALAAEFGRIMHAAAVMSFPLLGILAAVAQPLVLLIGEQWDRAAEPLRVLCLVSAVGVVNSLLTPAMQAAQRTGVTALFTWVTAAGSAAGLSVSAWLSASADATGKLYAVAWAALLVQTVATVAMAYVLFRQILRVSALPMITAALPSTLAGLAAFVTGLVLAAAMNGAGLPHLVDLILTGIAVTSAAGVTLFVLDRRARSMFARVARRFARRRAAAVPASA